MKNTMITIFSFCMLLLTTQAIAVNSNNNGKEDPMTGVSTASYKGGKKAMKSYIKSQLKYPNCARERGIEGQVTISFYVLADGTIHRARVVEGLDEKCDAEALKVINSMPKWTPATKNGKKVPTKNYLVLDFYLQG